MSNTNLLLDTIMAEFNLKNDAALAQFLDVGAPAISKIRHGYNGIGGNGILNVYDKTGWSIETIRELLAQQEENEDE